MSKKEFNIQRGLFGEFGSSTELFISGNLIPKHIDISGGDSQATAAEQSVLNRSSHIMAMIDDISGIITVSLFHKDGISYLRINKQSIYSWENLLPSILGTLIALEYATEKDIDTLDIQKSIQSFVSVYKPIVIDAWSKRINECIHLGMEIE